MKVNLSKFERMLRLILGTVLLAFALAGGPSWSFVGLYLIWTGAWRFCLLYWIFRNSSIGPEPDPEFDELKSKR